MPPRIDLDLNYSRVMYASYPLAGYFDKHKHRLLRYNMTDEPAVSHSDHCMWI